MRSAETERLDRLSTLVEQVMEAGETLALLISWIELEGLVRQELLKKSSRPVAEGVEATEWYDSSSKEPTK